jgi:hypothetical protein
MLSAQERSGTRKGVYMLSQALSTFKTFHSSFGRPTIWAANGRPFDSVYPSGADAEGATVVHVRKLTKADRLAILTSTCSYELKATVSRGDNYVQTIFLNLFLNAIVKSYLVEHID